MTSTVQGAVVALESIVSSKRAITEDILVGKDILELVTDAMYVDPLSIFREYVQNACDAIDVALQAGQFVEGSCPRVEIYLDSAARSIRIRDNGIGVPRKEFVRTLTAIGGSAKRGTELRGFRGVGRLAGLGYCQELIFRSRSNDEEPVSEIAWSGRRLKDLLRRADYRGDLSDAVREIAEINTRVAGELPPHFFEVELRRVSRLKNDLLLNQEEIRSYLSQVAPVPFHPSFRYGADLTSLLTTHGVNGVYDIHLNDSKGRLYRPLLDTFALSEKAEDRFALAEPFTFLDVNGDVGAVGWILHHSYLGAIPKATPIGGIRLRTGNMQVGSADLLANLFPEPRFNSWCVGEIHVLDKKILPNGRRDDFEPSIHYHHLQGQLVPLFRQLSKACRDRSKLRVRMKRAVAMLDSAGEALTLLAGVEPPPFVVRFVDGRLTRTFAEIDRLLAENSAFEGERQQIELRCKRLRREFDRLAPGRTPRRISIRGVASARRAAQEEVLELIYELSSNASEAHKLATRIVRTLDARAT